MKKINDLCATIIIMIILLLRDGYINKTVQIVPYNSFIVLSLVQHFSVLTVHYFFCCASNPLDDYTENSE